MKSELSKLGHIDWQDPIRNFPPSPMGEFAYWGGFTPWNEKGPEFWVQDGFYPLQIKDLYYVFQIWWYWGLKPSLPGILFDFFCARWYWKDVQRRLFLISMIHEMSKPIIMVAYQGSPKLHRSDGVILEVKEDGWMVSKPIIDRYYWEGNNGDWPKFGGFICD